MAVSDDFSINFTTGAIRHVSGTGVYPILELHVWAQDRSDDADGRSNDVPSALAGVRDATKPSVLTLPNNGPQATAYNIDATAAQFLNFGSIEQDGGDTLYTGLQSAGAIVPASPVYVVQDNAKLTKYWPDGHIQILILAKTGGTLIDGGNITAFCRKYGQSYSHADVSLAAGSQQFAPIASSPDDNISLSEAAAIAVFGNITVTVGDTNQDLGNGNGSKLYKGTIDCGGELLSDVYQALMAACAETSVQTVAGVPGWRYRVLDAAYNENVRFPFGQFAGGKFFPAQGWWLTNYQAGDAEKFQLTPDDGTKQNPPTQTGRTIANTQVGDSVFLTRSATPGGAPIKDLYALSAGNNSGNGTVVIDEAIEADTPTSGFLRIGPDEDRYEYTSWSGSAFTLAGTLSQSYSAGTGMYVPLIDRVATGSSESVSVLYSADRPLTGSVRRGTGVDAIQHFPLSDTMGSTPTTINTVRTPEV